MLCCWPRLGVRYRQEASAVEGVELGGELLVQPAGETLNFARAVLSLQHPLRVLLPVTALVGELVAQHRLEAAPCGEERRW